MLSDFSLFGACVCVFLLVLVVAIKGAEDWENKRET